MILVADWVLPISEEPLANGAIVVSEQGLILDVCDAKSPLLTQSAIGHEIRRFPGCVLMPGLINTHIHLEYSAFKGFSKSCGFGEWMLRLILARRKLTIDDYYVSALWGTRECVRAGMTYLAEASFYGWTSARAICEAGLRARVHLEVMGLDDNTIPQTMDRVEHQLGVIKEICGLVEPGLSPHAPYTVSARLYSEVVRYSVKHNLFTTTHLAESPHEMELFHNGTGAIAKAYKAVGFWKGYKWKPPRVSPVAYLHKAGALHPAMLAAHCVQLSDEDIATMSEAGTAVAHCPCSNRFLQCGSAPIAKLRQNGIRVGLGTDSLASNARLDLFAEMREALKLSRSIGVDHTHTHTHTHTQSCASRLTSEVAPMSGDMPIPAVPHLNETSVLRMATLEGAKALGLDDKLGSLEKGKMADIIAVRLPCLGKETPAPGSFNDQNPNSKVDLNSCDLVSSIVSQVTASDVCMTMVAGKILFDRDNSSTNPDDLDKKLAFIRCKI